MYTTPTVRCLFFFSFSMYIFRRDLTRSSASRSSFFFSSPYFVCPSNCECFLESFVFCICCNSLQPGVPCLSYFSACDTHTGVSNELSRTTEQKCVECWTQRWGRGSAHDTQQWDATGCIFLCRENPLLT